MEFACNEFSYHEGFSAACDVFQLGLQLKKSTAVESTLTTPLSNKPQAGFIDNAGRVKVSNISFLLTAEAPVAPLTQVPALPLAQLPAHPPS